MSEKRDELKELRRQAIAKGMDPVRANKTRLSRVKAWLKRHAAGGEGVIAPPPEATPERPPETPQWQTIKIPKTGRLAVFLDGIPKGFIYNDGTGPIWELKGRGWQRFASRYLAVELIVRSHIGGDKILSFRRDDLDTPSPAKRKRPALRK